MRGSTRQCTGSRPVQKQCFLAQKITTLIAIISILLDFQSWTLPDRSSADSDHNHDADHLCHDP
ncbi:hypothetical protein GbCGDNIH6_8197 [Granulibacter bethesdensis]|nr:hypothetical protein GbCGDNIH6_8197 [Granulibacter bethesdensis]